MPNDTLGPPKPVGIALVPCDNVYMDSSGKQALVGLFNRIVVPRFPAVKGKMCVYAAITEVYPKTTCKIDIVHAETDAPVFQAEGDMDGLDIDPTTICDLVFELRNVCFREAATYYVRLFGNNQILLQRPFELVTSVNPNTNEDKEGKDEPGR